MKWSTCTSLSLLAQSNPLLLASVNSPGLCLTSDSIWIPGLRLVIRYSQTEGRTVAEPWIPSGPSHTCFPYHFPGIADVVGFFPNLPQLVDVPGQRGVHRNCDDLAAQGNAAVADKTSSSLLNTEQNCWDFSKILLWCVYIIIIRIEGIICYLCLEKESMCVLEMHLWTPTFSA